MKVLLKKTLSKLIPRKYHSYIARVVNKYSNDPFIKASNLVSQHMPEVNCIDIGASYFPHTNWRVFLESKNTNWLAVEPNKQNLFYLNNWEWPAKAQAVPIGLSKKGGEVTLYVTNIDSGSSILEPIINSSMKHRIKKQTLDYYFPLKKTVINTSTLTDVININKPNIPSFIKLDTQGSELSILHGAENQLRAKNIIGIEMESTLLSDPIMSDSGKFWQAMSYLESFDYELLDLSPYNAKSLQNNLKIKYIMNECDAVFALKWSKVKQLSIEFKLALLGFYTTYGFFEEVLNIVCDDEELTVYFEKRGITLSDYFAPK